MLAQACRDLRGTELVWVFAAAIGAGATAITEDRLHRALEMYFAKPLSTTQYLLGRIGGMATWIFCVSLGTAIIFLCAALATTALIPESVLPKDQAGRAVAQRHIF